VQVRLERLLAIEGNIPSPATLPGGCRFHPRCPDAIPRCREELPLLERYDHERTVRCWRAGESGLRSALA
jgi:oligopeptide/dipeptide ABC transporter ATP-binding protein